MNPRVTLITLGVADLDRSRAFYEALGFVDQAPPGAGVAFFQSGGMVLGLWGRDQLAADSEVVDGGGWGGVTLAWNLGSPAEVDEALALVAGAGGTIARAAGETFYGGYSGIFIDPDGHPWEVAHNPHWALSGDGDVTLPRGEAQPSS